MYGRCELIIAWQIQCEDELPDSIKRNELLYRMDVHRITITATLKGKIFIGGTYITLQ
jgi:hypothetical protein